jgi:hypothetical protein
MPYKISDFVGTPGSLPNRRFGSVKEGGGISPSSFDKVRTGSYSSPIKGEEFFIRDYAVNYINLLS